MRVGWIVAGLWILLWAANAGADQRVEVVTNSTDTSYEQLVAQGLEQAVALEIGALLGTSIAPERLRAVIAHVSSERDACIVGYSDVTVTSNATDGVVVLDVRTNVDAIQKRVRDLGVLYTASGPKPYALVLDRVDPSRTRRLDPLQELSGLKPTSVPGPDVPVLRLTQEPPGAWTGTLTQGSWTATHTAKALEEVWFGVWKAFFSRVGAQQVITSGALMVRVSGWISSSGPMEFDALMGSWNGDIVRKDLVGVEMSALGLTGQWTVQPRNVDALSAKLRNAAQAQGLQVEIR